MEFAIYKTENFDYPGDVSDPIENYRNFFGEIRGADGNLKFKNLSNLALTCLCISHGNAVPERGFSLNKNMLDGRESLSEEIIEATRLVKDSVALHGGITNFPITRRLITLVEDSHRCYEQHLEEEKAKAAFERVRKSMPQKLLITQETTASEKQRSVNKIDMQIAEEKQKIIASDQLLADGKKYFGKNSSLIQS